MNTLIVWLSALACAVPSGAQLTTTLSHLPAGLDEVRIRNNSDIALVAFVIKVAAAKTADNARPPFVQFYDALIESSAPPLPAGQDMVVMLIGMGFHEPAGSQGTVVARPHILGEPIVAAGIFADGTTAGDPVLLTRLLTRRSNMLLAVETSLETLSDAGHRNIPRQQLIEQFQRFVDSVRRWYIPPEQQVGRGLYQSIIGKLKSLPEGQLGSPFPPSNFVESETLMLNAQRVIILESKPSLAEGFTGE